MREHAVFHSMERPECSRLAVLQPLVAYSGKLSTPFHKYGNVFHNPKRQRGDTSLTFGLYRHHGIRCRTYEMVYLVCGLRT